MPSAAASLPHDPAWVERTLDSLSLDELIGQVFMCVEFSWESAVVEKSVANLARFQPGGFFVFNAAPGDVLRDMPRLAETTRVPLLFAGDLESGTGHTLKAGQRFLRPMCRAHRGSAKDEYEIGRRTAVQGRALGLGLTFSPLLDLNTHPLNPDVNIRAYGEDVRTVTRLALPNIRGLQEHGMLAGVKHFPGNGGTGMDPHLAPAIVTTSASRYRRQWIEVYRRAFAEVAPAALMAGFLVVPSIMRERDPRSGALLPACLSREIMTGLLREELGFQGLAVTDALDMGAGNNLFTRREMAPLALRAGADLLLCFASGSDLSEEIAGMRAALERGEVTEERLREAARRVLVAKSQAGLDRQRSFFVRDAAELDRVLAPDPEFNRRIIRRGLTVVANHAGVLPLGDLAGKRVAMVNLYSPDKPFYFMRHNSGSPEMLADGLRARGAEVTMVDIDWHAPDNIHLAAVAAATAADFCFVNLFVVPSWAIGHLYPSMEGVRVFYRGILTAPREAAIVTIFGDPYARQFCSAAPTCLCTLDDTRESFEAVVKVWLGEQPARGRLPVGFPGIFRRGDGVDVG